MTESLAARFAQSLRLILDAGSETPELGLAVSGGGDSVAMLHLAVEAGLSVRVATVDHGLRPEAAAEAAEVGRVCAALGLSHAVLHWHWDGAGNLQDAARRGRRQVLAQWALRAGLGAVALAHTRDDVAETFLMRLARGAGVDGLAAMVPRWHEGGVTWVRPLLWASRGDLRGYLQGRGLAWVDDPSNDNERFDRVKARKALAVLRPLGISVDRLAEVAGHLAEARTALETVAGEVYARIVLDHGPAVTIDLVALAKAPAEVQRRVLVGVIGGVAPLGYAPRGAAVQTLLARLLAGRGGVLAGCRFQSIRGQLWAYREVKAVAAEVCAADQVWDGRWRMEGPVVAGGEVRALGEGIADCTDWRQSGLPRAALMACPALWQGDRLIAAPHAGFGPRYSAIPLFPAAALHQSLISH